MNLRNRIKRVENQLNTGECFCSRNALADLWLGQRQSVSVCRHCLATAETWTNLAKEAKTSANLTDGEMK